MSRSSSTLAHDLHLQYYDTCSRCLIALAVPHSHIQYSYLDVGTCIHVKHFAATLRICFSTVFFSNFDCSSGEDLISECLFVFNVLFIRNEINDYLVSVHCIGPHITQFDLQMNCSSHFLFGTQNDAHIHNM